MTVLACETDSRFAGRITLTGKGWCSDFDFDVAKLSASRRLGRDCRAGEVRGKLTGENFGEELILDQDLGRSERVSCTGDVEADVDNLCLAFVDADEGTVEEVCRGAGGMPEIAGSVLDIGRPSMAA